MPAPTALLLCSTSSSTSACWRVSARMHCCGSFHVLGLALRPCPCHPRGMDTSTTLRISPVLEPETMMALMLRYCEVHEEAAYQYARQLVRRLTADVCAPDAVRLARDIVTEATNDVRDFEGEEVADRINVALRRLLDRVEADQAFMTELADWDG